MNDPTKTGPRKRDSYTNKHQRREVKAHAKAVRDLKAEKPEREWHREITRTLDFELTTSQAVKIAKLVSGELWLRRDHASTDAMDPKQWDRARDVSIGRLQHEITMLGSYLLKKQVDEYEGADLMALLNNLMLRALS